MIQILVVDDTLYFRKQMLEILNKLGTFKVIEFESGIELIDYYSNHYQIDEQLELIFIDCFMERLNGFETLGEIMKMNPNANVAMMTGRYEKNVIDGIKLGAKWFIWKPFTEENIKIAINRLLPNCL